MRELQIKGIDRYLIDESFDGEPLHLHISEVEPGQSSHPPHTHGGYEAFYMMAGEATLLLGDERITLRAGEAAVIDPQIPHGLYNSGSEPMRYIVVIRP